MKKILLTGMVAALVLGSQILSPAQESGKDSAEGQMKPVVAVMLSSFDQVINDIRSVSPQIAMTAEGLLNAVSGGQGLEGLDKKRPMGLLVRTDGQQFPAQVFLPVRDLKKLLKGLEPTIGTAEEKNGIYEITVKDRTIYLKQSGEWTYASISADGLENLPKNPLESLSGLEKEYDLGIRLTVKNIPQAFRQLAVGMLQTVGQQALQQKEGESEQELQTRTEAFQQSMKQLTQMLNELDTLTVGLKIDPKSNNAFFDFAITAVEGSQTAKQYAAADQQSETHFAGFQLDGAAVVAGITQKMTEATIAQAESSLDTAKAGALKQLEDQKLGEEELALAKDLVGQMFEVVGATLKGGKFDMGASVKIGPDVFTLVMGGHVLDTQKVEQILKKLAEKASKENSKVAEAVKLNAEQYEGIHFHRISMPTDQVRPNDPNLGKLVGKTLDLIVGIGPESVYVAAGRDASETLKKAIDGSKTAKKVPPMQVKIALTPIVKFVAEVAKDAQAQNVANILTQVLEGTPNKDHIVITSTAIPNGAKTRIELEQGVLKILGALPMLATM